MNRLHFRQLIGYLIVKLLLYIMLNNVLGIARRQTRQMNGRRCVWYRMTRVQWPSIDCGLIEPITSSSWPEIASAGSGSVRQLARPRCVCFFFDQLASYTQQLR